MEEKKDILKFSIWIVKLYLQSKGIDNEILNQSIDVVELFCEHYHSHLFRYFILKVKEKFFIK
jgi:hypothetical protein